MRMFFLSYLILVIHWGSWEELGGDECCGEVSARIMERKMKERRRIPVLYNDDVK